MYLYAVLGFILFRDSFNNEDFGDRQCDTMFQCFFFVLPNSIKMGGGVGELMSPAKWPDVNYFGRVAYDLSFFIFVIIILLNCIFGIVIDAFSEIRDEKYAVEEDMKSLCFICGLESSVFDKLEREVCEILNRVSKYAK